MAAEWPMPMQPRSTTGIFSRPLDMNCILAIWLTISPQPSSTKSTNMKSTTGFAPAIAAPQARPVKPRSLIGVSRSRSAPYLAKSPAVVRKLPPRVPIPSPSTKMRSSAAISASSASTVAWMKVSCRAAPLAGVSATTRGGSA